MMESSWKVMDNDGLFRDPLTGAFSRALLLDKLNSTMEHARFGGESISICMIDLDYFKSINDAFGHLHGDKVLQSFVQCVQGISRQSDLLFRYGGDEFILFLPHTTKAEAVSFAKRIIEKVQVFPMETDSLLNLSISIGIASFPEDASDPEPLIAAADYSCYEAKRRGRGQVFAATTAILPEHYQMEILPRLIERDGVLVQFQNYLHQLSQKGQGIFSILGVPGSGRTFLLNYLSTLAQMNNFCVINLRAFPTHKNETFGVLNAAVDGELFLNNQETLVQSLCDRINAEGSQGIIVALDNLSNSDHATIHLLRQCLTTEASIMFGLVYTAEPASARPWEESKQLISNTAYLHPFSPEGARAFLRSTLSWEPESAFMDWLYKETHALPKRLVDSLNLLIQGKILQPAGDAGWTVHPSYQAVLLSDHVIFPTYHFAHNLPKPLTDFIGRVDELRQINALMDQNRLVTLCGPGGIGKTRLSIQVGWTRLPDFSDGVFFVPLASLGRTEELTSAIAKVLGVQEIPDQTLLSLLKQKLHNKHCLLILDNFEQIVAAAPLISDLLTDLPLITVLVTSREILNIRGEKIFNVPPMNSPSLKETVSLEKLTNEPAIALFASRAQSVKADFTINESNATAVTELCANLEGIPLAIELAAAHITILSPREMVQKSLTRLDWLKNGPRDLPERQKTLRGVVDWSFNLLTIEEQHLFAYLGVFSGGFTLEAAEYVAKNELSGENVAEELQALIQKSLLRKVSFPNGDERFEMLEIIREHAVERLSLIGENSLARRRHADYLRRLVIEAEKNYFGPTETEWLSRLDYECANFRQALDWTKQAGKQSMEIDLIIKLSPFWDARGYWHEGHSRLENLINRLSRREVVAELCRLYLWYGVFSAHLGELIQAEQLLEKGLSLCEKNGDLPCKAWLLYRLGQIQGVFLKGVEKWEASLEIFRRLDNRTGVAIVLTDLGRNTFYMGNHRLCEKFCNESLAISQEIGYKTGIVTVLRWLGEIARADGHYERATEFFERALKNNEIMDNKFEMINTLFSMAELSRSLGKYDEAIDLYKKHCALCKDLGYKPGIAYNLPDLGEIYRYQGKYDQALDLYRAALILLEEIGDQSRMTWVYRNLAEIALAKNQTEQAKSHLHKSLGILREHSHFMLIPLVLGGFAQAAIDEGEPERAARLLGSIYDQMQSIQAQISLDDWSGYERRLSEVREHLGESDFSRYLDEGKSLTLEAAVSFALEEDPLKESSLDTA